MKPINPDIFIDYFHMKLSWIHARRFRRTPNMFVIEPINRCNLNCSMCPEHGAGNRGIRPQGTLPLAQYRDIVNRISHAVPRGTIIAHGAGEPLLHPEYRKILESIRQTGNLSIAFLTNATLLDADLARDILNIGIDEIGFSINGTDPESYRRICGKDLYSTATANISQCLALARTLKPEHVPRFKIQIVDSPETRHSLNKFVTQWLHQVDEIIIQTLRSSNGREIPEKALKPVPFHTACHRLITPLTIAWNGDVHLCCEDWHGEHKLGNIFTDSLETIIERQRRVMHLHRTFRRQSIPICRNCAVLHETRTCLIHHPDCTEIRSPLWRRLIPSPFRTARISPKTAKELLMSSSAPKNAAALSRQSE